MNHLYQVLNRLAKDLSIDISLIRKLTCIVVLPLCNWRTRTLHGASSYGSTSWSPISQVRRHTIFSNLLPEQEGVCGLNLCSSTSSPNISPSTSRHSPSGTGQVADASATQPGDIKQYDFLRQAHNEREERAIKAGRGHATKLLNAFDRAWVRAAGSTAHKS